MVTRSLLPLRRVTVVRSLKLDREAVYSTAIFIYVLK